LAISTGDDWPSTTLLTLDLLHLMRLTPRQKSRIKSNFQIYFRQHASRNEQETEYTHTLRKRTN